MGNVVSDLTGALPLSVWSGVKHLGEELTDMGQ